MSVIDDILGKKNSQQAYSPQIQQDAAQINNPQAAPQLAPAVQPAAATQPVPVAQPAPNTQPIGTEQPAQSDAQDNNASDFLNNYNNSGSVYSALQSSFGKQQELDPKKVQSQRNLARLADAATYLTDIFNASQGGDVVNHNSIAANEDNKIFQYRRYLDSQNRQYNMLAYQAKMRDLQNAIAQKMNIQNILYRMQRDKNTSDLEKEKMKQAKDIADNNLAAKIAGLKQTGEYNQAKLAQSADYQNKRLAQENQKIRIAAANAERKASGISKDTQILTKDGIFQIPKSQADSFYGQVYNKMYHEAQQRGDDTSILNINMQMGEGGDQTSKMKAIVNAYLNEYPDASEWVKNNAQLVSANNNESTISANAANIVNSFNPSAYFPQQEEKPTPSYSLNRKPALFGGSNKANVNKKKQLPDNIL